MRAHDLAIAAFLAETIYNFGELVCTVDRLCLPHAHDDPLQLMHPILDALDNTPVTWLKKLLFTFNEGNIGKFEGLSPLFPQEVCGSLFHYAACLRTDLAR